MKQYAIVCLANQDLPFLAEIIDIQSEKGNKRFGNCFVTAQENYQAFRLAVFLRFDYVHAKLLRLKRRGLIHTYGRDNAEESVSFPLKRLTSSQQYGVAFP